MKLKEFLRKKFTAADVRGDNVEALLGASAIADLELEDTAVAKFDEFYLSRDRAENDASIVSKIQKATKKDTFTKTDELLEPFYELLAPEKTTEIKGTFETFKRMEMIQAAVKDVFKNNTTKKSEDVQKVEADLMAKIKKLTDDFKIEKDTLLKQTKEKITDYTIKSKLAGYKLAEVHTPLRDTIMQFITQQVKSMNHNGNPVVIEQDDAGAIHLRQSVDGTLRDIYVKDNDKLTLDKELERLIDPYIVKSNGPGKGGEIPNGNQQQPYKQPTDTTGLTLGQINAAKFAQQAAN